MNVVIYIGIIIVTFFFMEFVAWFTHKYVMHGVLWKLHRDHHEPHEGFFEKNDFFFLIFAIPSWLCMNIGGVLGNWYAIFVGIGILAYGICYFLVHEVLIHRRFKWFDHTNNTYFRALRKAHKIHHKKMSKEDGECFGMLIVPKKYFKEAKRAQS